MRMVSASRDCPSEKVTIIVLRILIAAHITSPQCNDGPCIVQKVTWPLCLTTCMASAGNTVKASLAPKCPPRCLQHQYIYNALHAGQQQVHAPPLFKLLSIVDIPEISSVALSLLAKSPRTSVSKNTLETPGMDSVEFKATTSSSTLCIGLFEH